MINKKITWVSHAFLWYLYFGYKFVVGNSHQIVSSLCPWSQVYSLLLRNNSINRKQTPSEVVLIYDCDIVKSNWIWTNPFGDIRSDRGSPPPWYIGRSQIFLTTKREYISTPPSSSPPFEHFLAINDYNVLGVHVSRGINFARSIAIELTSQPQRMILSTATIIISTCRLVNMSLPWSSCCFTTFSHGNIVEKFVILMFF